MAEHAHPHQVLLNQLRQEYAEIFTQSAQGVYVYMDDPHWIGNDRLAAMLGYASAQELHDATANSSFLDTLVAPESRQRVVENYQNVVNKKVGADIRVTMKKKDGATFQIKAIFVPIMYQGTLMALHFLSPA
ncbi:MAG: hypothetical protein HZB53_06880 [Chloroflexi bacterium]|nr:hypothetical protein [Chloroflexota bacterium]